MIRKQNVPIILEVAKPTNPKSFNMKKKNKVINDKTIEDEKLILLKLFDSKNWNAVIDNE
jgi:hypothetical protein